MEVNSTVYVKTILELMAKPSASRKDSSAPHAKINTSSKLVSSIIENIAGDFTFLEPDDYFLEVIAKNPL
jgi:hypothetical protein